MPLPFLISVILKGITGWIKFRLMLVRRFQETMSEIGMGMFIAYGAQDTQQILNLCSFLEALIKAYITVLSPACIFSSFMKEIVESPQLRSFMCKYPGYDKWEAWLTERNFSPQWTGVKSIWAEKYPGSYALPPPNIQPGTIVSTPQALTEWIFAEMSKKIDVDHWTPQEIVNYINQNLITPAPDPQYTYAPLSFWRIVHPWIDLDWTVIKTYIILYHTYLVLAEKPIYATAVMPYVPKQRVHVYANDVLMAVDHLSPEGTLTINIPDVEGLQTITLDTYGLKTTIPLRIPFEPSTNRPIEIIMLNVNDFDKVKQIAQDYDCVMMDVSTPNVSPEDLDSLLNTYKIKLMIMMDTQPYYATSCPALLNILYTKLAPYCTLCDNNVLTDTIIKSHFKTSSIPALLDYFTYNQDKVSDSIPYAHHINDANATWNYKPHNKSWMIEVPYDGFWKDIDTVDKWLTLLYCQRVLVMCCTATDTPSYHQYPTFDQTMQAYASQFNIKFTDLRS